MTGPYELVVSPGAERDLRHLKHKLHDHARLARVVAALEQLSADPGHRGLRTKTYTPKRRLHTGEQAVMQSYVENNTPGAWRIFWQYGPGPSQITVLAVSKHE